MNCEPGLWYHDPAVYTAIATWVIALATGVAGGFGAVAASSAASSLKLEAEPAIILTDHTGENIVPSASYIIEATDKVDELKFRMEKLDTSRGFTPPAGQHLILEFLNAGRSPCVELEAKMAAQGTPKHSHIPFIVAESHINLKLLNPNYPIAIVITNTTSLADLRIVVFPNATRLVPNSGKRMSTTIYAERLLFKLR